MNIPAEMKYTKDHEWAKKEGDYYIVGITEYAQGELGDVVYVELPSEGSTFKQNDVFGSIEAVKAAADLYCPVSGEVIEVNSELTNSPETVNKDPYNTGWMIKIKPNNLAELNELMDAAAYAKHIGK